MDFIGILGFLLLGCSAVLGIIVGILFVFPNTTFFGAKAVNERDTQIVYRDEILTDAFANGKFILDSTSAQIEVKMSNVGYEGEGTIVINETATGIAFNSLSRTLLEWTETFYNNEIYYRLKVLEPTGVVFNQKPTVVYINLPHRDVSDSFTHDFVLQNVYSNVNFSLINPEKNSNDALKIGNLVVESAASVNIASGESITLNQLEIKGDKIKFDCQSAVLGDVSVTGSKGTQNFNGNIAGSIKITGEQNKFRGDRAGNVTFEAKNGSLSLNNTQKLTVQTDNADITVGQVSGGAVMTTKHGNLRLRKITGGGLSFIAGSAESPVATGIVAVNQTLTGNIFIRNYGTGNIDLNGVNGNVDIESCQTRGKNINVVFSDSAADCEVKVLGYDGDINVQGINGWADIEVKDGWNGAGAANIKAQFNKVTEKAVSSCIRSGGYVNGHDDLGNVEIKFSAICNNVDLYIYGARKAQYQGIDLYINNDFNELKSNKINLNTETEGYTKLSVYSQNKVNVY